MSKISLIINSENPTEITKEYTAEQMEEYNRITAENDARKETFLAEKEAEDNLKASAKAKLVAGEPLTEAEADTIVL
tara:strand:+ start:318 stop:548 length:231 start_codon:yes stop_codon:yes gene_type:complete